MSYIHVLALLAVFGGFVAAPTTGSGVDQKDAAASYDDSSTDFVPVDVVPVIGQGYDSIDGKLKNGVPCVKQNAPRQRGNDEPPQEGGQAVNFDIERVTDTSSLKSALSLSATATFGFGMYHASMSTQYATGSDVESQEDFVSIVVDVRNQSESEVGFMPTDKAVHLHAHDPIAFENVCGNQFVVGKVTGGKFVAIVRFTSASDNERSQLNVAINGAVGAGSGTGTLDQKLESLKTHQTMDAHIIMMGKSGTPIPALTIDAIIDFAKKFSATVKSSCTTPTATDAAAVQPAANNGPGCAYTTLALTSDYESVMDKPGPTSPKSSALEKLASSLLDLYRRRNGLAYIQAHAEEFPLVGSGQVDSEIATVKMAISNVKDMANACIADTSSHPKSCTFPRINVPGLPQPALWHNMSDAFTQTPNLQVIARTPIDEDMRFEATGYMSLGAYNPWIGVGTTTFAIEDRNTAAMKIVGLSDRVPVTIPKNSNLEWRVNDPRGYDDNFVKRDDPLRYLLYPTAGLVPLPPIAAN